MEIGSNRVRNIWYGYENVVSLFNGYEKIYDAADESVIYEFNLQRFDLETLTDGNAQWYNHSSFRAVSLEKGADYLNIVYTAGTKQMFNLDLPQLAQYDNFTVEMRYGGTLPYKSFFGPIYCNLYGSNGTASGIWRYYNGSWSVGMTYSYAVPADATMVCTRNGSYYDVGVYMNGTYVGTTQCNPFTTITHNVDYNGSSLAGTIQLYKLKITKDT